MKERKNIITYNISNIKQSGSESNDFSFYTLEEFFKGIEHLKKPHRQNFYALIIVFSGIGEHIIDLENFELISNRVFLINYGQVHTWKQFNKLKGYMVFFTTEFYNLVFTGHNKIKSDAAIIQNRPYIDLDKSELQEWKKMLSTIELEHKNKNSVSNEIICLLLKVLVLKYNSNNTVSNVTQNKSSRKIGITQTYKSLIGQYYKEWKLPKYYTQLLFVTPNYLNSICNEVEGVSATQLIQQRVVLEAKRLLSHTDLTATQIAYELGFEDNSHFGKYFKNVTGFSPDGFRKNFNQ